MNLPDLKHLSKIIDLCRKKGLSRITIGDISLELGEVPSLKTSPIQATLPTAIDEDWKEPSSEELLFWSSPSATTEK